MTDTFLNATAHCKINLGLEIIGRRPDGYHDLETIYCPMDLADHISCTPTDNTIDIAVEGIQVPVDETNLCLQAARLLASAGEEDRGVRITLMKSIPVGAGLGGGSSDAARTLRLLNSLWKMNLADDTLRAYASKLGADVPYFLDGGLAFGSGIGDALLPLSTGLPYWIGLVVPPVHVSTAWAYGRLAPQRKPPSGLRDLFPSVVHDLPKLDQLLRNDFEDVVLDAYPIIRETMETLSGSGLSCVRMSGTGSSVFGLAASEDVVRDALSQFAPPYVTSASAPVAP
jgi:4-diphosphocytidyl-2-C-methyl-D-erythritol kinase